MSKNPTFQRIDTINNTESFFSPKEILVENDFTNDFNHRHSQDRYNAGSFYSVSSEMNTQENENFGNKNKNNLKEREREREKEEFNHNSISHSYNNEYGKMMKLARNEDLKHYKSHFIYSILLRICVLGFIAFQVFFPFTFLFIHENESAKPQTYNLLNDEIRGEYLDVDESSSKINEGTDPLYPQNLYITFFHVFRIKSFGISLFTCDYYCDEAEERKKEKETKTRSYFSTLLFNFFNENVSKTDCQNPDIDFKKIIRWYNVTCSSLNTIKIIYIIVSVVLFTFHFLSSFYFLNSF